MDENLVVKIVGDASSYVGALTQSVVASKLAVSSINSAFSAVGSTLSSVGSLATGVFSGITGSVTGLLTGIGNGLVSAVGAVTSGITAMGAASVAVGIAVLATTGSMIQQDNAARKLGLTTTDLAAAQLYSGASAQTVMSVLGSVQMKLFEASKGTAAATRDFQALGIASGQSAEKLSGGKWAEVVDAIGSIENRTMRASMAYRFLGDNAGEFLAQMERSGSAGDSRSAAERMGLGASSGEMEGVRQVAETLRQAESIVKGIFNQVVIAIGPLFAELSKSFDLTRVNLTWIKPMVLDIAKGAAMIGAFVYEAFAGNNEAVAAFFRSMAKGIDAIANYLSEALIAAFNKVSSYLGSKMADPSTSLGYFFGGLDYLGGYGNKGLDKIREEQKQKQLDLMNSTRATPLVIMEGMQKELSASGPVNLPFVNKMRSMVKEAIATADKDGLLGSLTPNQRTYINSQLDEGTADSVQKAIESYKRNVPEALRRVKTGGSAGSGGIFDDIFGSIKTTSAFQNVEDFFNRVTGNMQKVNDLGRENQEAIRLTAQQFNNMRQASGTAVEAYRNSLATLNAYTKNNSGWITDLYGEDRALVAYKMFQDLQSGVGMPSVTPLAGAAEAQTKEAYSSIAQYSMIMDKDRNDVQMQMKVAIELGNEQRAAAVKNGEKLLELFRKMLIDAKSAKNTGVFFNP